MDLKQYILLAITPSGNFSVTSHMPAEKEKLSDDV